MVSSHLIRLSLASLCGLPASLLADNKIPDNPQVPTLSEQAVAKELGWVISPYSHCGGYYLEPPFTYPISVQKKDLVEVTSNEGLLSQRTTSTLIGKVTVTRDGQQITSNKAYLYRDANGKLSSIDMLGDVHLREPNTLVIGKEGRYFFDTKTKSLMDIVYRTSLSNGNGAQFVGAKAVPLAARQKPRRIDSLTAWGKASEFSQAKPRIYDLYQTSYSTCPPLNPTWHVKASHIILNKNTGRGSATHARLYLERVPIFYFPYLNFSIDRQRKSGFLTPTLGPSSSRWGTYFFTPYYWNIAPNQDMTFTPGYLSKRGVQFSDTYRYLTSTSSGKLNASILPNDREFTSFKHSVATNPTYANADNTNTQADFNRLQQDTSTRKDFIWRDTSRYNDNWSSHVDFNYVGDDYYLGDFGGNLNQVTTNQLLQQADLTYKNANWNFTSTLQTYQTLNPINQPVTLTQYRRLPQLTLTGDYPDQPYGLTYFISNDATHFDIRNTPGNSTSLPIGYRFHTQPGISLPYYLSNFYVNPRAQFALTDYSLYQISATNTPAHQDRALPIFDVATGVTFSRDLRLFGQGYQQTLEPQLYYEYIPYRNQASIPTFDTTVNTLTYDQLFNYNRFTGIDRIGDANQLSTGIATRFIDNESGYQKIRLAAGEIFYFSNRKVTLCNTENGQFGCSDNPDNPANTYRLSPISGELDYNVDPAWRLTSNPIWDPVKKQLSNTTVALQYLPDPNHLINLGYSYVRNGDIFSGIQSTSTANNLKLTDFSFSWPLVGEVSAVGRWSEDWNLNHLQNLIYGLQYDTCCWAFRAVGAKTLTGIDTANNDRLQYDTQFYVQFDLKGLTNIETGDPTSLLTNITGYNTQFGQGL